MAGEAEHGITPRLWRRDKPQNVGIASACIFHGFFSARRGARAALETIPHGIMSESIVAEKSFRFAVRIVRLCRVLRKRHIERELLSQLIRSGTSVSANLAEALHGNSTNDFLYRVRIALRECSETQMWLRLLHETEGLQDNEYDSMQNDCSELLKMLSSIALTVQEQTPPKK